jgi:hypothetical protein
VHGLACSLPAPAHPPPPRDRHLARPTAVWGAGGKAERQRGKMKKKHRSSARPAFHGVSAGARQVAAARCSPAPLPPPDWLTLPLPARPNAVTGASGGDPATERKGAVNPPRPTTAGADKQTQRPPLTVLFIPLPPFLPPLLFLASFLQFPHLPLLLRACAAGWPAGREGQSEGRLGLVSGALICGLRVPGGEERRRRLRGM